MCLAGVPVSVLSEQYADMLIGKKMRERHSESLQFGANAFSLYYHASLTLSQPEKRVPVRSDPYPIPRSSKQSHPAESHLDVSKQAENALVWVTISQDKPPS